MKITLGDKSFTISALNWTQLGELQQDISACAKADYQSIFNDADARDSVLRVVLACMHRKHPEVSEQFVSDNLDLANFTEIRKAIFGLNGFSQQGEAPAATSATST